MTLLAGVPASADTYTIYNLTTDSYLPLGIDNFATSCSIQLATVAFLAAVDIASSFLVKGTYCQGQIRFQLRLLPTTEHHALFSALRV
jgi:hypothetical protein